MKRWLRLMVYTVSCTKFNSVLKTNRDCLEANSIVSPHDIKEPAGKTIPLAGSFYLPIKIKKDVSKMRVG